MIYSLLLFLILLAIPFSIWIIYYKKFVLRDKRKAKEAAGHIRSNGKLLAKKNSGGRIGGMNYTTGMLKVEIYSSGIICIPFFQNPIGIQKKEITGIIPWKGIFTKGTEINYKQSGSEESIIIYFEIDENLKQELLG